MLVDAARSTPGVLQDPPPFARVTQIADPVVDYQASMWIEDYAIAPQVKADFGALVWYLSYRHDVPLPNPAQDLYLFDGAKTAIESTLTSADIRRRLLEGPMFAELGDDALDQLAASSSLGQYQQGETIIVEGTQRNLMLLVAGRARLVLRREGDDDLVVLDLEPGEVFGVLSEPSESGFSAAVIATADCDVVRIPPEGAGRAIALAPDIAGVLEQLAVTRRRRIERVLRRSARALGSARSSDSTAQDTGS
jgi:CRP-like cAMP-binding protein